MTINWGQGFRRLARAILAVVWAGTALYQASEISSGEATASTVGAALGGLLVFTVFWLALCAGLAWIARGFTLPRS